MRQIIILMFGLGIMGCSSYDYKVNNLEHRKLGFEELPLRVKNFYYDPTDFMDEYRNVASLVSLDAKNEFRLETINTWIGPWVAYEKIIDISNGISYRIDQGTPHPFVIYKKKLYLTDKFNIFTTVKDYSTLEFKCYSLKDKY